MATLEEQEEEILGEVGDLDDATVKKAAERLGALKLAILALIGMAADGMLLFYYRQILARVEAAIKSFENLYFADVLESFERYWEYGLQVGRLVTTAAGVPPPRLGAFDKELLKAYIIEEAAGASAALRAKLVRELNRSLLGGESADKALKDMAALLTEEKTIRGLLGGVSSSLVGAVNVAEINYLDALVAENPSLQKNLFKIWNWSHVQRMNHAAIDGVSVPYEERFHVPGWKSVPPADMRGPHDPSAPIGQVANCKCFLTFKLGGTDGPKNS